MKHLILIFIFLSNLAQSQVNDCFLIFHPDKFRKQLESSQGLIQFSHSSLKSPHQFLSTKELDEDLFLKLTKNKENELEKAFQSGSFADKPVKNFEELEQVLNAYHFIDLPHLFKLSHSFTSGKSSINKITSIYGKKSFNNFIEARKLTLSKKLDLSETTFGKLHKTLMKGKIEDLSPKYLGVYREDSLYFRIYADDSISPQNMSKVLEENPYISLYKEIKGKKGIRGDIYYPALQIFNSRLIAKVKKYDPTLAKALSEYKDLLKEIETLKGKIKKTSNQSSKESLNEDLAKKVQRHDQYLQQEQELNNKLTKALVEDNIDWFRAQRKKIGSLNSVEKLREFSDLTAHFHRNMISIHPFTDGNGRTAREFALYLTFKKEGLIPPKLFYPDGDILLPLKEYQSMVWDGFISGNRLQDDLVYRLKNNLNLKDSPELTLPSPARPIRTYKKSSGRKRTLSDQYQVMPPGYFDAFVDVKLSSTSYKNNLEKRFYNNFMGLRKEAVQRFQQDNIVYTHSKRGKEFVSLYPVTDDFIESYQRTSFSDAKAYKEKITKFYEPGKVIWRGLADTETAPTREALLRHFKDFDFHFASNSVMNSAYNTKKSIISNALKDFRRYNKDLFSDDDALIKMAKDHSETGPLYDNSYGYSTSKKRSVGKAFAMGAMVIADYGKHMDFQHLLKGRILVGQLKSIKDVDLTTLKQVRSRFSYSYGRQQEVMGIGVADPDAIMIVQHLDEQGDVIHTYLRDINNPNKIFMISGEASIGDSIPEHRILNTIDLNDL